MTKSLTENNHSIKDKQLSAYAQSLIEAVLDPIVTVNMKGEIIDMNQAWVNIVGMSREQLKNTNIFDYFTDPQKTQEVYQEILAKGSGLKSLLKLRNKKGNLIDVSLKGSIYKDDIGNIFGTILVVQDIAEQKWAAELINASKELAFQNAEKEKRAAELSVAKKELAFQNAEKEKRAAELSVANKELAFQNTEKEKRAAELIIASKELLFQNREKEKRASELAIADKELIFQNKEKEKREIANKELEALSNSLKLASQYSLSLIEASLDPLVTINKEGKITDMNQATVNIIGLSRAQLAGTDFFDYFTEAQKARDVYQEVFEKGSVVDFPLTLRHKDGKLTDVLFNGSVYKDHNSNVLGVVIVARDVTAQKLLSKYSRSLIEASLDPLITISAGGKITDMNQATINITGEPREKLTGSDFYQYFTEPQKAREVHHAVFAKGSVVDFPLTLRHKDGKLTVVLFNGSVYNDDRGNVWGAVVVARDITERKQIEKEREKLNEQLEGRVKERTISLQNELVERKKVEEQVKKLNRIYTVLSNTNQLIVRERSLQKLYDEVCRMAIEDGKFRMALIGIVDPVTNKLNLVASSGFEVDYLKKINMDLNDDKRKEGPVLRAINSGNYYLANDIANKPEMAFWQEEALALGYKSRASFPVKFFEETKGFITLYSDDPFFFDTAEVKLLDEMAKDISFAIEFNENETKRKRAEEEIKKSNETLERKVIERTSQLNTANIELEQFAYVASHDLQEPLRTISNFVVLFEKKYLGKFDDDADEYLRFIVSATARLQNLIKDLLEFSRVGKNSKFETVDCNKILAETLAEMDVSIKESNAKIISSSLPVLKGNEMELKRLFQNLISNAIKFRKKDVNPEVTITVEEKEYEYLFAIKDNGIGIEEQFINKLFILFHRLHSNSDYPGTGIGLATCKKVVAMHGGKIWVKTKLGEGSTFYFSIAKKLS